MKLKMTLKDVLIIKLYYTNQYTRNRRRKEFLKILEKYNLTETQAQEIAKKFEFFGE